MNHALSLPGGHETQRSIIKAIDLGAFQVFIEISLEHHSIMRWLLGA